MKSELQIAKEIFDKLKLGVHLIKFIKKDGSERIMSCTLDFNRIPAEHKPKSFNISSFLEFLKKGSIRVYDLENMGWRSIPYKNIEIVE